MKTYVCDVCGVVIDKPYVARMREFHFVCDYDLLPLQSKEKVKIHLCNNCFEGFKSLAKQENKVFSQYPCSVFLHNALRFIRDGKPDVAYEEICWALLRSGAELSDEERIKLEELKALKEGEQK